MRVSGYFTYPADFVASVAQLVEQLIRNEQVSGSSPLAGSIHKTKPASRL